MCNFLKGNTREKNKKPPVDIEKKKLARENEKLRAIVLSQSRAIADLKKEMNLDW